jgi:hypothetical protein
MRGHWHSTEHRNGAEYPKVAIQGGKFNKHPKLFHISFTRYSSRDIGSPDSGWHKHSYVLGKFYIQKLIHCNAWWRRKAKRRENANKYKEFSPHCSGLKGGQKMKGSELGIDFLWEADWVEYLSKNQVLIEKNEHGEQEFIIKQKRKTEGNSCGREHSRKVN